MADKLPSGAWRVRYRINGKRSAKSFPSKILAEKFEAKVRLNLVAESNLTETSSMTFTEFGEQWLREYCYVEKAESQWSNDAQVIRDHLVPAFGNVRLHQLKKSHLALLKTKLVQATNVRSVTGRYKPKTVNNILAIAKVIMATAVKWDLCAANPFSGVSPVKTGDHEFAFWKPEERDEFLKQCSILDRDFADAVLLACHTGLRRGELGGLRWASIDLERKKIRVNESYNARLKKSLKRTKNMKFVDIPMNALVMRTLSRRKATLPRANSDATVFPEGFLSSACHRLAKRCEWFGIRVIRFHDLRHTFASCLAMAGVDLMVIKDLMRHQSYQMTLRYAHLHPEHLQGVTDVLCSTFDPDDDVPPTKLGHENDFGSRGLKRKILSGSRLGHEAQNSNVVTFPRPS